MSVEQWKSAVSYIAWCNTCKKSWKSGKIHAIARLHSELEGHNVKVVEKTTYIYLGKEEDDDE